MMSGYGLYYTQAKGRLNFRSTSRRTWKLYLHYWLVTVLFAGIGCFVAPESYPGDACKVIENLTAWHCTYNYETWFLLPYVVISFLSPLIFRVMDIIPLKWSLLAAFLVSYGAQFVISRYVATDILTTQVIVFAVVVAGLLFDFVIGAAMAKYAFSQKAEEGANNRKLPMPFVWGTLLIAALMTLRCFVRLPWDAFYTFFLVFIFLNMRRIGWIDHVLAELGKKSMVMWMVHTYFSIYLFHDFIYGFKYPIVIYVVLVGVSYLTSTLLMKICSLVHVPNKG